MGLICRFGLTPIVFETRQLNKVGIDIFFRKVSCITMAPFLKFPGRRFSNTAPWPGARLAALEAAGNFFKIIDSWGPIPSLLN